jgi:DUF177 domain-containing protein
MSGSLHAWYSLHDLETLGARQSTLDGEIAIGKLARLAAMLYDDGGSVRASLRFQQRGDGWLAVSLEYETEVHLTCQRCLEPYSERVAGHVELVLAESEAMPSAVPEGYEPVELDRGRLLPAEIIEDELIVSIPLVPKHARVEDCGSLAGVLATQADRPDATS